MKCRIFTALLLLLVGTLWSEVHAGYDIYLDVPGLTGTATATGYAGWIECSDVFHSVSAPDRAFGRFTDSGTSLYKSIDASSPALWRYACDGQTIDRMEMVYVSDTSDLFYSIIYSNVSLIIAWHPQNPTNLQELISFEYDMMQWSYTESGGSSSPEAYLDTAQYRSGYTTNDIDNDGLFDNVDPDDDNDGSSDLREANTRFNPTDGDSFFRVTLIQKSQTNAILEWTCAKNMNYDIFASSEPDATYSNAFLGTIRATNDSWMSIAVPINPQQRFYTVTTSP